MPNMSNKNFTTLNNIFNAPVQHRRDFVKENKENVRNKKKTYEKPQIDSYMPLSSSADRISSQSSGYTEGMIMQQSKIMPLNIPSKTRTRSPVKKQPWTYGREASDRKAMQKTAKIPALPRTSKRVLPNAKASNMNKPKTKTSSTAVQTDDIDDEIYLYNALKKCASPAFKSALKAKYVQKERDTHSKQSLASASQEIALPLDDSRELQHYDDDEEEANRERIRQDAGEDKITVKHVPQRTESVQTDFKPNIQRSIAKCQPAHEVEDYNTQSQLNVMTMPADGLNACTPSKCTNCPVGYHLLSDEERASIRAKLLDHESLLIRQLNSFPLAIETLRVRQSKTRIEKELTILEQNLRKLTKRKVYAKIHE